MKLIRKSSDLFLENMLNIFFSENLQTRKPRSDFATTVTLWTRTMDTTTWMTTVMRSLTWKTSVRNYWYLWPYLFWSFTHWGMPNTFFPQVLGSLLLLQIFEDNSAQLCFPNLKIIIRSDTRKSEWLKNFLNHFQQQNTDIKREI